MTAPVPPTETLAGFLRSRRDWLQVRTQPHPNGSGWDVVLVIDGTYANNAPFEIADPHETSAYFARWLSVCFANDDAEATQPTERDPHLHSVDSVDSVAPPRGAA